MHATRFSGNNPVVVHRPPGAAAQVSSIHRLEIVNISYRPPVVAQPTDGSALPVTKLRCLHGRKMKERRKNSQRQHEGQERQKRSSESLARGQDYQPAPQKFNSV